MKRFLAIVGGIFLVIVVVVAGLIGYSAYQGTRLDTSSKSYVDENLPPILASWSKGQLQERASPQLLQIINSKPDEFDQLFQKLSKLGAMKSYDGSRGDSRVMYTTKEGKVTTASYVANANFENGNAEISIGLVQNAGQWQIAFFNVKSPLFLK